MINKVNQLAPVPANGITAARSGIDIFPMAGATPPVAPAPKHSDNALFYDVEKHGRLEIGEALYLYTDGTFEKVKYG